MFTQKDIEEAGLQDFRVFLRQVWDHLALPEPTPVQNDIAHYLQHGPRRKIIEAFRGVGKSYITTAYVLWRLLLNPQEKIMVVSANQELADSFSKFCWQLIDGMPLLQHLKPGPNTLRQSAVAFDVGPATPSKSPSVKSVGITGQLTGSRATIIIPDDIEIPKNSFTHLLRERLSESVKEFDAVLSPGGEINFLGTPQTEQSIYPKLEGRGYSARIWPSEMVALSRYRGRVSPMIQKRADKGVPVGTPMDPSWFGRNELDERMASYGRGGYALQFLLDTSPSDIDRHPLKLGDMIVTDLDEECAHIKYNWGRDNALIIQDLLPGGFDGDVYYKPAWKSEETAKYNGTVMAVDPSGKGSDETAYAIVRFMHGQLFLVASGGYTDGFAEETLRTLAFIAVRHKVNTVVCEENYGGGMFTQLLVPHLHRAAEKSSRPAPRVNPEEWDGWSRGQKEARICDVLQPILESHLLVVNRRVIERDIKHQEANAQYSLMQQLTRITRDRGALPHDDRVEALSMACSFFVAGMHRDRDKAILRNKAEALDEELRKFKQHAINPIMGRQRGPLRYAGRK